MLTKIYDFIAATLTTSEQQHEVKNWQLISGIILFLACGVKLYYGLQNTMDIQYADEAAYLRFGLDLFDKINYNWGPLYAVWYKCLSAFTTNTIQLYYLNFALVSILLVVLLYAFLIRISIHPILVLFITFSVLISNLNVTVWPRISHFCVVLCLLGLVIATYLKNNIYKCIVFTIVCLCNAYARPEFYLAFVLMVMLTIVCIYFNEATLSKKDNSIFGFSLVVIALLHFIFRFPSNDFFGYNRGVAAFYQHYAWNYKMRTHGTFDAWLVWEDLSKQKFGDCNSMWCVITSQPLEFISNTLFNVRTYLLQLLKVFTFVAPTEIFHWKKLQLLFLFGTVLVFFILLFRKKSRALWVENLGKQRFYLILLFCFIAPTLFSCIVIFPRDHYLFLQMLFFILILSAAFAFFFKSTSTKPILFFGISILLFLATPNVKSYSFMKVNTETNYLCNKMLVQHLEKKYSKKPHTIFTNLPFVTGMLPKNFKEVNTIFDKKKNIPFTHYLDSANVDIVIVLPSLLRDPHIASDSTWTNFYSNYTQFGFEKDVFNDCEIYLLTKNSSGTEQ
ncbi:MAG: hypothetical protein KDD21_03040 [Bacteroidetes bacterium]|nr:hypothetical protein [Bacteroidota bacterium]